MKFIDIKKEIEKYWECDDEFIYYNIFGWFRYLSPRLDSSMITKDKYTLEFYNDAKDNFFRVYDSKNKDVGFIDGGEVQTIRINDAFISFDFNNGGNFMFSAFEPQ